MSFQISNCNNNDNNNNDDNNNVYSYIALTQMFLSALQVNTGSTFEVIRYHICETLRNALNLTNRKQHRDYYPAL